MSGPPDCAQRLQPTGAGQPNMLSDSRDLRAAKCAVCVWFCLGAAAEPAGGSISLCCLCLLLAVAMPRCARAGHLCLWVAVLVTLPRDCI